MRGIRSRKTCLSSPLRIFKIISLMLLTLVIIYGASRRHMYNKELFQNSNEKLLNDNNIVFLDQKGFANQLQLSDSFFKYLTPADLNARNTNEIKHEDGLSYFTYYRSSFREFTENEKKVIIDAVKIANNFLVKYPNLRDLTWNFVKVNSGIEQNWPHTHNQVIVLNSQVLSKPQDELVETLIHEKLHIYQRVFVSQVNDLYTNYLSFHPVLSSEGIKIPYDIVELMRSNPDLNRKTYMFNKQFYIAQLYNSAKPKSLADSKAYAIYHKKGNSMNILTNSMLGIPNKFTCQLEHPHEIIACIISKLITEPSTLDDKEISDNMFIKRLIQWMKKNL